MLKIAYDNTYVLPLSDNHKFPMEKYALIIEQLIYENCISCDDLFNPVPIAEEIIFLTHSKSYLNKLNSLSLSNREMRAIGFPQNQDLIDREKKLCGGTLQCCEFAFQIGVSLNVAGGTHHAFAERGEGFCLLNDFAIAANYLLSQQKASRILIIDLDVHQGNGTASIFKNQSSVFTFSMHGANNYPFKKEQSSIDIGLRDGINGIEYLSILKSYLNNILNDFNPDFAFYLSGVDVLSTDRFGKMNLTIDDCCQRDALVFESLKKNKIPVVVAMGGGYSRQIRHIVDAHCHTFRIAKNIYV